jgi:hypothetical protein
LKHHFSGEHESYGRCAIALGIARVPTIPSGRLLPHQIKTLMRAWIVGDIRRRIWICHDICDYDPGTLAHWVLAPLGTQTHKAFEEEPLLE